MLSKLFKSFDCYMQGHWFASIKYYPKYRIYKEKCTHCGKLQARQKGTMNEFDWKDFVKDFPDYRE